MTTDDSEEQLIRARMRSDTVQHQDLQVRMRGEHVVELEEDLVQARRKKRQSENELSATKERMAQLEEENERLLAQKEALRQTAINIAVDRRAIFNTIEFLNKKWGKNAPKNPQAEQLAQGGRLVLFDEAEIKREEEKQKMLADEEQMANMITRLDEVVDNKVRQRPKRQKK